jgi:TIR domain
MTTIFLNYRSADSGWAVLLDHELSARFGTDNVFRASRSVRPGQDFPDRIRHAVRASLVMIAVIGPGWSTATDPTGCRRLDNAHDWVRQEIALAFRTHVPVLPVLTDHTPPLNTTHLPADIAQLARCQYVRIRHRSDRPDLDRLADELTVHLPPSRPHQNTLARWRKATPRRTSAPTHRHARNIQTH